MMYVPIHLAELVITVRLIIDYYFLQFIIICTRIDRRFAWRLQLCCSKTIKLE